MQAAVEVQHLAEALARGTPQAMPPARSPLLHQSRRLQRLAHEAVRPLQPVLAAGDGAEVPDVQPLVARGVEPQDRLELVAPAAETHGRASGHQSVPRSPRTRTWSSSGASS